MAYTPNTWNDGDVITKDKMNALETGVKNVCPKSLQLTADSTGKITGGTLTITDDSTISVTVSQAES